MALTRTLQNESAETPESVNIAPFNRSNWVETDGSDLDRQSNVLAAVEHRVAGDDPELPLIRQVVIRTINVSHPAMDKSIKGRAYDVTIYSTQRIDDTVSGLVSYVPVSTNVRIAHGGATILNYADVLQQLLSTVAELYDSVTTGTPDSGVMAKLALGAADI